MNSGLRGLLSVMSLDLQPAGVVMGAGVYQIVRPAGCAGFTPSSGPTVYPQYEDALRSAWRETIRRLEDDALRAGAHWVLGVGLTQGWTSTNQGVYQYQLQLTGTAVRVPGTPALAKPRLSTLSMQEFLKLLLAGWAPCGITWGISAVHVHAWDASAYVQRTTWSNAELQGPTAGMMAARSRLELEARQNLRATGGKGAVKMTIDLSRLSQVCRYRFRGGIRGTSTQSSGILIDGRILGTVVVPFRSPVLTAGAVIDLAEVPAG
jgi:uncharacterized protein YbjQ (UPF0145 family)